MFHMNTQEPTKVCSKCQEEKSLKEFYKSNLFKDKLDKQCKKCKEEYRIKSKERLFQKHKKFQLKNPTTDRKICSHCKEEKSIAEFGKNKNSQNGFNYSCKNCANKNSKKTALKNKLLNKQNPWNNLNILRTCSICKIEKTLKEFCKNKSNKYGFNYICKICSDQHNKQWRSEHPEEIRLWHKQHHIEHREERNLKGKQWYSFPKNKKNKKEYQRNRVKTNPEFKIIRNARSRNKHAFESRGFKKPNSTIELLGCTALEFQTHIISLFKPGMTKENNGKRKWQQHHIVSFSSVDLKDPEQIKKVCHYTNIVPMWEDEHIEWHRNHPD